MKITFAKLKFVILLLSLILLFTACSGSNNDVDSEPSEESTTENNTESEDSAMNSKGQTSEQLDVPSSTFTTSDIEWKSILFKSDIDGGSELTSETIEVLTEFDAKEVDEGTKLTLPENILFDFDSSELLPDAVEAIEKLVHLAEDIDEDITIVGHTDSHGEDDYNQTLSESRAIAVVEALVDDGVKESRLVAEGKGATDPVADNEKSDGSDNPDGREKNRRVEVIIHGFDH